MADTTPPEQHDTTTAQRGVIDRVAARFCKRGRYRTAPPSTRYPRKSMLAKAISTVLYAAAVIPPLLLAGVYTLSAPLDNASAGHARGFTQSETVLAQALFGSNFKTDDIVIRTHDRIPGHIFNLIFAPVPENTSAYVRELSPNDIHMVDRNIHAVDYGRTTNTFYETRTFVHEVAHVWQFRQPQQAAHCSVYEYTLTPQSRFEDFCIEQQAEILADYAHKNLMTDLFSLGFMAPDYLHDRAATGSSAMRSADFDPNLVRVVEQQFPHARAARLRIEEGNVRTLSCTFNAVNRDNIDRMMSSRVYQDAFNACAARHVRTLDGQIQTREAERSPLEAAPASPPATAQRARTTGNSPG